MNTSLARGRAVSLVEILVVVGILALLAAIGTSVLLSGRSGRAKKQTADCATNLRQVGVAMQLYTGDYDGLYPPAQGFLVSTATQKPFAAPWSELLVPYVRGTFPACPARPLPSDEQAGMEKPRNSGYGYNSHLSNAAASVAYQTGAVQNAVTNPALVVAAFDSRLDQPALTTPDLAAGMGGGKTGATRHQNGANYVFADGHLKWFKPDDLRTDAKSDGVHPGFGL